MLSCAPTRCRGHAALAIHNCQEWLREGKQTIAARFTCRTAITEMHSMCSSSRQGLTLVYCSARLEPLCR
jgi:hypothetical protein